MAAQVVKEKQAVSFWTQPGVSQMLTVLAWLSFMFLCMILPLVGPAAVRGSGSPGAGPAPFLAKNYVAFSSALAVSLVLASLALYARLRFRRVRGGAYPRSSVVLLGILVFALIALMGGWFAY